MKVKRNDNAIPAAQITNDSITLLERELENRKRQKAIQDAEVARIRRHHEQLQAEEAERLEAERLETERRQGIIDRAEAQVVPTGAVLTFALDGAIDLKQLTAGYGLVIIGEGRIQLPVITSLGHCTTIDSGPVLAVERVESQLVMKSSAGMYLALYKEQARHATEQAIAAERARAPEATVLYLSCEPSAQVVPDQENQRLVRIKAQWPTAFAYIIPTNKE